MAPPARSLGFGGFAAPNVRARVSDLRPGTRYGERALQSGIQAQAGVIQAQDRARRDFTARLNAFTSQIMQTAAQQAQIEGAEFGIENAPTAEIQELANGDFEFQIDDSEGVLEDRFSVYGQAARKAALTQMRVDLLAKAQVKMGELTTRAIDPQTGLPTMAPIKLKAAISGLIKTMTASATEISPVLGRKIGAELSVDGHNKFLSYNAKWLGEQQKKNKAVAGVFIDGQQKAAQAAVDAGNFDQIAILRRDVEAAAVQANLDAGAKLAEFDKLLSAYKANSLMQRATEAGLNGVIADIANDYQLDDPYDPQFEKLWNSMSDLEKTASLKSMIDALSQQRASEVAEEGRKDRAKNDAIDRVLTAFYRLPMDTQKEVLQSAVTQLRGLGAEGVKVASALEKKATTSPVPIVQTLEVAAAYGTLTRDMVVAAIDQGLAGADVGKYMDLVTTQITESPEVLVAERRLKEEYGLPEAQAIFPGEQIRQAAIDYNRARNRMIEYLSKGEDKDGKPVTLDNLNAPGGYLDRMFQSDARAAEKQAFLKKEHDILFKQFSNYKDAKTEAEFKKGIETAINETGWLGFRSASDEEVKGLNELLKGYDALKLRGYTHDEIVSGKAEK
tara:strand:+ start:81 stop:1931 length:1851 start_codon:yes stop_codon:yes gene_type:complete